MTVCVVSNSNVDTMFGTKISAVDRSHVHVSAHEIGENVTQRARLLFYVANVIISYVPQKYYYTSSSLSLFRR